MREREKHVLRFLRNSSKCSKDRIEIRKRRILLTNLEKLMSTSQSHVILVSQWNRQNRSNRLMLHQNQHFYTRYTVHGTIHRPLHPNNP